MTVLQYDVMAWDDEDLDEGPVPLWWQIASRVRSDIDKGEFQAGHLLPSESALNRRFGVSRTTSRAALDRLEQEGRIRRQSGKGSVVLPPRLDQPLDFLAGFAEDMRARGHQPGYRTRSIVRTLVPAEVSECLALPERRRAVAIDRLLLADGEPIGVSHILLSPAVIGPRATPSHDDLDRGSLYEWLQMVAGVRLAGGEEFIEASVANEKLASDLEVRPGAPLLVVRRISRTTEGLPVEYVVTHYRADRYRLKVSLRRL